MTAMRRPESSTAGGGRRRWLPRCIVALLAASVPWYFPAGAGAATLAGVPLWCVVSFACYAAIAALVAAYLPDIWDDGAIASSNDAPPAEDGGR